MNKKVLVSLVSDQTIPNIEFIKEFQDKVDCYVFITTEFMESEQKARTNCILAGANIPNVNITRVIVRDDSMSDINAKLLNLDKSDAFVVNLTGGTKMMSIATYDFFRDKNARIYYKPIRSNKIISIEDDSIFKEINTKLTVNDYLLSYGVESTSATSFEDKKITKKMFDGFIDGSLDFRLIETLRVYYRNRKPRYTISNIEHNTKDEKRIENLSEFLLSVGFCEKDEPGAVITKNEIAFLTGGWYEEMCFYYFKDKLVLSDGAIQLGVKLKKSENVLDNDLDVVFVYNNNLYVVECKTAMSTNGKVSTALFNETIYKASALRAKFGLSVKNLLLTLSTMEHKTIDYEDRARVMNISLFGRKYFDGKIELDDLICRIKSTY